MCSGCIRHRAQAVADSEEGLEKYLTRSAFLAWSKRMPAVAQTLQSLLAGGVHSNGGGSVDDGGRGGGSAAGSGDANEACTGDGGGGGGVLLRSGQPQAPQSAVPQLISLAGVALESCLLRREWAWALATSGFLAPVWLAFPAQSASCWSTCWQKYPATL